MRRHRVTFAAALLCSAAATAQSPEEYSFIRGADLYDALSQDSMLLQGYTLGVADALKHTDQSDNCFTIPERPDADQIIFSTFLDYWSARGDLPDSSIAAITEAMQANFPCN